MGEIPLVFAIGCALAACVLMRRLLLVPFQLALFVQSVLWLALSLTHVLPPAWTVFYEPVAALRHWIPMLLIPAFATAFSALLLRYGPFIWKHPLAIAAVYFVVTRIGLYMSGVFTVPDPTDPIPPFDQLRFYSVSNMNMPILALVYASVLSKQRSAAADAAILLLMFAGSPSATNCIIAFCVICIRFLPAWKLLPLALGCALLVVLWIVPPFAAYLYANVDPNTGVRAIMWRDAFTAAVQTYGLGVGYGTEWMRSSWPELSYQWFFIADNDPSRLYVPTHSSFYDMLLRLGFVGAILFVLWFASYALIPAGLSEAQGKIHAMLAVMLFASASVNPAITMVNIFIGSALIIAAMDALRTPGGIPLPPPKRMEERRPRRRQWAHGVTVPPDA